MSLSQTEQAVGHWRCVYCGPAEAHEHCGQVEAPVEPVAEFREVTRHMLRTGLVVGAVQGVLNVADDRVKPAEVLELDAGRPAAGNHGLVLNAGLGDAAEATQPVADADAIGIEELLAPGSELGLAKALDDVHARRHRVTIVALGQGSDERGLVRRAAPGRLPVAFPAPVHVIDLDHANKALLRVALERDLQQLRPAPSEQHRRTLLLAVVRGEKLRKTQTVLRLDRVLGHHPPPRCSTRCRHALVGGSNREPAESHG